MKNAALRGDTELMSWLYARGSWITQESIELASRQGHLHVLMWVYSKRIFINHQCMLIAAANGHVHILAWGSKTNMVFSWTQLLCEAQDNNQRNVIMWIKEQIWSHKKRNLMSLGMSFGCLSAGP
jgi:hypothetical protein